MSDLSLEGVKQKFTLQQWYEQFEHANCPMQVWEPSVREEKISVTTQGPRTGMLVEVLIHDLNFDTKIPVFKMWRDESGGVSYTLNTRYTTRWVRGVLQAGMVKVEAWQKQAAKSLDKFRRVGKARIHRRETDLGIGTESDIHPIPKYTTT